MPKVELKQPIIDEIAESVKDAKAVVLVDYRGLTVAEDTKLRRNLREAGVKYKVYKNTFMKRAFKDTDFAQMDDMLDGPSALAISGEDDIAAAPRILANFAKDVDRLEIKGGVVEGVLYDEAGIKEIAKIPARDVLLSRLFGSMQSPITNFARVIKQIAEKKAEGGDAAEAATEETAAPAAEAAPEAPAEAPAAEAPAAEAPASATEEKPAE